MAKASFVIRRILIILLVLLIILIVFMFTAPALEKVDETPVLNSERWMASLSDGRRLSQIVIPGTHDSATQYVQLAFFSKCQALSIEDQLRAGFRYLDIRLGEDMKLKHGFTDCKSSNAFWAEPLRLDSVLYQVYAFLRENPTETVIFAVKQEHGSDSVEKFQTDLKYYIDINPEMWLLTDTIPTLGQARGKIVLMRRYEDKAGLGAQAGIPLLWEDQSGSDGARNTAASDNGYTLWVQDRYEYGTSQKWYAFRDGCAASKTGAEDISLNFLSTKGTLIYGHPYFYARELNRRLMAAETSHNWGWTIVDFGSAKLAEHIYSINR